MPGFIVNGLGGHKGSRVNSKTEYYYTYFWEIINLFETNFGGSSPLIHLKEAALPTFTTNKENYQGASLEYKFAKSVTWEDIKVSWYDNQGLVGEIRAWRQSVWTPECGLKMANQYKRQSRLHTYLPTGQADILWTLFNSWPSQIRYGDLTYTNSDVKLVEVTVTYDWAEEEPQGGGRMAPQ